MEFQRLRNIGIGMLAGGAALVSVAIVLEGDAGRMVNGAGGMLWFTSTAVLTAAALRSRPSLWRWGVLALLTVTVPFVVRPSAAIPTLIGFVPAGFVMGWLAPKSRTLWAALVPAWYLPAHIGTAVSKSAVRSMFGDGSPLRTDPPPTAAFVPLLMVACALAGGLIASRIQQRDSHTESAKGRLSEGREI